MAIASYFERFGTRSAKQEETFSTERKRIRNQRAIYYVRRGEMETAREREME